jgi:hypothetical protein
MILPVMAIDPGTTESAVVVWNGNEILQHYKDSNDIVRRDVIASRMNHRIVVEMIASYGMPVGKTTFQTVLWIGRYIEAALPYCEIELIYRQEIKLFFCKQARAKDAHVRQALIDRYGEPGKKASPGLTYGLKADQWQAFALAVYTWDMQLAEVM